MVYLEEARDYDTNLVLTELQQIQLTYVQIVHVCVSEGVGQGLPGLAPKPRNFP